MAAPQLSTDVIKNSVHTEPHQYCFRDEPFAKIWWMHSEASKRETVITRSLTASASSKVLPIIQWPFTSSKRSPGFRRPSRPTAPSEDIHVTKMLPSLDKEDKQRLSEPLDAVAPSWDEAGTPPEIRNPKRSPGWRAMVRRCEWNDNTPGQENSEKGNENSKAYENNIREQNTLVFSDF